MGEELIKACNGFARGERMAAFEIPITQHGFLLRQVNFLFYTRFPSKVMTSIVIVNPLVLFYFHFLSLSSPFLSYLYLKQLLVLVFHSGGLLMEQDVYKTHVAIMLNLLIGSNQILTVF